MRSKSCHVRMNVVAAIPTAANAKLMSIAAGTVRTSPRRAHEPQHDHDDDEPERVERPADQRPADLAKGDVADATAASPGSRRTSSGSAA